MASKFGGVAVEEKTSGGSRFGGVPIEAPQDGVVSDFIANSPIGAVQGMAEAIRNPSATVKSALSENERLATEAKSAFGSGDYATSARKGANFLLNAMPGLGSALDAASDDFAGGDFARGTAKTLGLASNMLVGKYGPKVMDKATSPATPKPPKPPSKPVTAGGLMEMAKTGKDILQVLQSPNPLTKLAALGRLFEKFASEVTPIEAPPAPTVVEAPPVASGTPVRPPLRGKQFGTFNDPTAPPLPAGVEPSGPVRPPLQGRQFGTTVAKMMREEVPGKQFGTSSQSRLVPAEAAAAAPAEMPALEQITEWLASRDGGTASRFTDPVVSEAPITKQTLGDIMDRLMKNRKVPAEVPAATVPAEVPPAAVETPVPIKQAHEMTTREFIDNKRTKAQMIKEGADGYLSNGVLQSIPVSKIVGLEPTPAMEGGYQVGRPITQPIEVAYNAADDSYTLYAGNHRVTQAQLNGSSTIPAYVEGDALHARIVKRNAATPAASPSATPAPSAAGKPVTAATLMEEVAKPDSFQELRDMIKERAGKKVPPFDWGDEAQYQEYQKALVEDSNIYGNNRTTMADRVTRFMKKNGIEPTDSGIVRALNESAEDIAVSPTTGLKRPSFNAADHEVLFDMIKDRMETPPVGNRQLGTVETTVGELMEKAKSAEKPVARAGNSGNINANGRPNAIREVSAPDGNVAAGARPSTGKKTDVFIPGERQSIPARYEVRELGEIKSSHNGQTFSHNPEYELQNERDYSKPENQQRVIEQSSEDRFRHQLHITDNPDMSNGPPLLDEGGNALGGNSRTMHLQRVYGRNEGAAKAYRQYLIESAQHFGIEPASITGMKQPVLVRIVSDDGLATVPGGAKWAIRKTNVPGGAALSASERAAADAGQMSPDLMSHISSAIENEGAGATLNDALTGQSGTRIVNKLIEDGFFSEQERPGLMDGRTGALTQLAKDRISKALLGKFFRDSDQISRTPPAIRNVLERASAPIARIAEDKAWDVTNDVREAVDLIEYARAHDIKNLADVVGQESMFGDAPEWSDGAVKIAEMLRDAKPNDVVNAFRKYANSKEPTMFGESTPSEAFKEVFGADKPKVKK